MIFLNIVKTVVQYMAEGFLEIFSPNNDYYPAIGIQPFSGTIAHRSRYNW